MCDMMINNMVKRKRIMSKSERRTEQRAKGEQNRERKENRIDN
jgi:hypothetical protein